MPLNPAERVIILESDREWPVEFKRLAVALRRVIGDETVEHIGSTAVPGLAAKPILDVAVFFGIRLRRTRSGKCSGRSVT